MSLIVGVRQKCNFHCPNQLSECQYLCISLINITASFSGQNTHTHVHTHKRKQTMTTGEILTWKV